MKLIIQILLYLWQLPQNLLGFIIYLFYYEDMSKYRVTDNYTVYLNDCKMGCSLGRYIFVWCKDDDKEDTILHESGHVKQSMILGPLYLLIIGLPSVCWLYYRRAFCRNKSYYSFYTESWADKLSNRLKK